jgi:hypothetical protein
MNIENGTNKEQQKIPFSFCRTSYTLNYIYSFIYFL